MNFRIEPNLRNGFLVALCCLPAWIPFLSTYLPWADDFPLSRLVDKGWSTYFIQGPQDYGIYRLLGRPVGSMLAMDYPTVFPYVAVILHLAAIALLYRAIVLISGRAALALLLSILFGAFPCAFQAVTWGSGGFPYLISCLWLLIVLNLLLNVELEAGDGPPNFNRPGLAAILGCGTFGILLFHEGIVFVLWVLPFIIFITSSPDSIKDLIRIIRTCTLWWALLAAGILFIILFKLFPHNYRSVAIHPQSLVSPWLRLYTVAEVLTPMTKSILWPLAIKEVNPAQLFIAPLIFCLALVLTFRSIKFDSVRHVSSACQRPLAKCAVLLVSGACVYAISGGFSLDSRKKYVLLAVFIIGIAILAGSLSKYLPPRKGLLPHLALILVLLLGTADTWLVLGVNRCGLQSYEDLLARIKASDGAQHLTAIYSPDLFQAWPGLKDVWGRYDDDWAVVEVFDNPDATSDSAPKRGGAGYQDLH